MTKTRVSSLTSSEKEAYNALEILRGLRLVPQESYDCIAVGKITQVSWDEKKDESQKGFVVERRKRQIWFEWEQERYDCHKVTMTLCSVRSGYPDCWDPAASDDGYWCVTGIEIIGSVTSNRTGDKEQVKITFEGASVFNLLVKS